MASVLIWVLFMLTAVGWAQDTFCVRFGTVLLPGYHDYLSTNTPPNPTSQLLSDTVIGYDVQFECAKTYTAASGQYLSTCSLTNNTYIAVLTNYSTGFFDILSNPWTVSSVKLGAGSQSGQSVTTTEFTAILQTSKWPWILGSINQIVVDILLNGTNKFDGNFSANIPLKVLSFSVSYYFGSAVFNTGPVKPFVAPCQSPSSFLTPWTNSPAIAVTPSGGIFINGSSVSAAPATEAVLTTILLFVAFVYSLF